jgi:hypothetical protein
MNVLVWKSYGDISVYDVSTPEKLKALIHMMLDCIEDWGLEKTVQIVEENIEAHPNDFKVLNKCFNSICNAVGVGSHELFEAILITEIQ